MHLRPLLAFAPLLLTGCMSLQYDLEGLPFPVSASPVTGAVGAEPFEIKAKHTMWVHGLLGDSQPDVRQLLIDHCIPTAGIANFRVTSGANIFDWLGSHLSLGFVRLKTVKITGVRMPPPR